MSGRTTGPLIFFCISSYLPFSETVPSFAYFSRSYFCSLVLRYLEISKTLWRLTRLHVQLGAWCFLFSSGLLTRHSTWICLRRCSVYFPKIYLLKLSHAFVSVVFVEVEFPGAAMAPDGGACLNVWDWCSKLGFFVYCFR